MTAKDIIARLEEANGPDRGLDLRIGTKLLGYVASNDFGLVPKYTASLDAAVALVKQVLPGWGYRVATCSVSDDAWLFPDFNCPVHGQRLRAELDQSVDWTGLTDVDLRPAGREPIALLISLFIALDAIAEPAP